MILKFQGKGNSWVLKESESISHSHFAIVPEEMKRVKCNIIVTQPFSEKEGVVVGMIDNGDPEYFSFEDLITEKIEKEFGILSDNIHYCFGETPDVNSPEMFFGVAVVLDNNEVYILDGAKRAFVINNSGKTIDKL